MRLDARWICAHLPEESDGRADGAEQPRPGSVVRVVD